MAIQVLSGSRLEIFRFVELPAEFESRAFNESSNDHRCARGDRRARIGYRCGVWLVNVHQVGRDAAGLRSDLSKDRVRSLAILDVCGQDLDASAIGQSDRYLRRQSHFTTPGEAAAMKERG